MKVSPISLGKSPIRSAKGQISQFKSKKGKPALKMRPQCRYSNSTNEDMRKTSTTNVSNNDISCCEQSPLKGSEINIYYKKNIIGNSNFLCKKNNSKEEIKEDIYLKRGSKDEVLTLTKGHIRHISVEMSSTIQSPNDNLQLHIKIERISNIKFGKTKSMKDLNLRQTKRKSD